MLANGGFFKVVKKMESLRSKSWIKHVLIALLGLNFLAINNFAYAIVESEASPLLTKYEALSTFSVFEVSGDVNETRFKKENCHDMAMSVEEADSTSSDPAQSCCDEPCDCNGPTCGGASFSVGSFIPLGSANRYRPYSFLLIT